MDTEVREMTVEEVAKVLNDEYTKESDKPCTFAQWEVFTGEEIMHVYAKALAKLGTIRIVGGV